MMSRQPAKSTMLSLGALAALCLGATACLVQGDVSSAVDAALASDVQADLGAIADVSVARPDPVGTAPICEPPAIDVLLVLDDSTSMCGEHLFAGHLANAGIDHLVGALGASVRVATTTMDAQCDPSELHVASQGRFNTLPSNGAPPSCYQSKTVACLSDLDCATALGSPHYRCKAASSAQCLVNPNGSINSYCWHGCTTDEECRSHLGLTSARCVKPSDHEDEWGCMAYPSGDCPDEVPPVIEIGPASARDQRDLVRCQARPRVNQAKCFTHEQGLKAAWMALDPEGPNDAAATAFLRPEAELILFFVSDEDDCSVAEGQTLYEGDYDTCGYAGTEPDGPLDRIDTFVSRFRSLKADPSKVWVVALSGDSMATSEALAAEERAAYDASKTGKKLCFRQTSICSGAMGPTGLGTRWIALAEAFGDQGFFLNLCEDAKVIVGVFTQLAELIGAGLDGGDCP